MREGIYVQPGSNAVAGGLPVIAGDHKRWRLGALLLALGAGCAEAVAGCSSAGVCRGETGDGESGGSRRIGIAEEGWLYVWRAIASRWWVDEQRARAPHKPCARSHLRSPILLAGPWVSEPETHLPLLVGMQPPSAALAVGPAPASSLYSVSTPAVACSAHTARARSVYRSSQRRRSPDQLSQSASEPLARRAGSPAAVHARGQTRSELDNLINSDSQNKARPLLAAARIRNGLQLRLHKPASGRRCRGPADISSNPNPFARRQWLP